MLWQRAQVSDQSWAPPLPHGVSLTAAALADLLDGCMVLHPTIRVVTPAASRSESPPANSLDDFVFIFVSIVG